MPAKTANNVCFMESTPLDTSKPFYFAICEQEHANANDPVTSRPGRWLRPGLVVNDDGCAYFRNSVEPGGEVHRQIHTAMAHRLAEITVPVGAMQCVPQV